MVNQGLTPIHDITILQHHILKTLKLQFIAIQSAQILDFGKQAL